MKLTHIDASGNARMADTLKKSFSVRSARARAELVMKKKIFSAIAKGNLPKGDVFAVAKIAGIQAAKRTAETIPLCHPIAFSFANIGFSLDKKKSQVVITSTIKGRAQTGFEMEALVAVAVSALTIYDMAKGLDREITIKNIYLLEKSGGKSKNYKRKKGSE